MQVTAVAHALKFALLPLFLCGPHVFAQSGCDAGAPQRDAARVASIRAELRAVKTDKDDIDDEAPPAVEQGLPRLKDALTAAVRDTLACTPETATPKEIEGSLAELLKANAPQPAAGTSVSNDDPRYKEAMSFEWSANLQVHATLPKPNLLQVEVGFNISCGEDTVLLVFERRDGAWREAMRWQSAPYKEISGAFGDGFQTAILTPKPGEWRLVSVHGTPWCSSRMSAFDIDLLAPSADAEHPRVVWHTQREYSRSDYPLKLKALSPDTFEVRNHADEMQFNEDGFERLAIFRYRLEGDRVMRLEPIAGNARGFVEEWLTMPWEEAAAQSAPSSIEALRAVHRAYETSYPEKSERYTSWAAGPVRACEAKGRFQVAFDSQVQIIVPGKPGGDHGAVAHHYFFLQEVPDGYRMESVAGTPNAGCKGPDLMHQRQ